MNNLNFISLLFLINALKVLCEYYKGGVYTSYMPDSSSISFNFQIYYKRTDPSSAIFCDDNTINSRIIKTDGNAGYIRMYYCNSILCSSNFIDIIYNFKCINYDPNNNWAQFENSVNVPLNSALLQTYDRVKFSIQNWNGVWSLDYWGSTYIFYAWTHTYRLIAQNTPPNVRSFAVFNFKCGCETKFKPIIIDPDQGDEIRCRKSNPSLNEGGCGTVCTSRYILDETTCTLTFPADLDRSLPIELQIEDYNPKYKNGSQPMSSTSFQFYAVMSSCTANLVCDNLLPKFTDSIEPSGSCVAIRPGGFRAGKAEAYSIGNRITEIRIFKDFVGFNYNQNILLFNETTNTTYYDYNITIYDSSRVYQGRAIFEALDSAFVMSEKHVIDYVFNYEPVELSLINNFSKRLCYDTLDLVELEFVWSRNIYKPVFENKARLKFVREDGKVQLEINTFLMSNQIEGDRFRVRLNKADFSANYEYAVLFDFGIVNTGDYCRPSNEKMSDMSLFRFLIEDDSASRVIFANNDTLSSSDYVSIDYTIKNAELVTCYMSYYLVLEKVNNIILFPKVKAFFSQAYDF